MHSSYLVFAILYLPLKSKCVVLDGTKAVFNAANTTVMRNEDSFGFARFVKIANKHLEVQPFREIYVKNYKLCLMDCVADDSCISLNYQTTANKDGRFLCQLLDVDHLMKGDKMKNNNDFMHFTIRVSRRSIFGEINSAILG